MAQLGSNTKQDGEPEYQYNKAQYHPVEEYLITKTEKLTSDTPAFVLEVTWPRVALFYHPASPLCKDLRDRYVAVAREIRRRSIRAPVEFWAISCEVHRDACEDLGVTAVPRILAFPEGKIEPTLIQRTQSNGIDVEDIITVLGVNLKEVDEEEEAAKREQQMQERLKLQEIEQRAKAGDDPYQLHIGDPDHMREILHPHSSLKDVFADAMTSLLYSIDLAVEKDRRGQVLSWSYDKYHSFREWLDLMHWALPTRDMANVHNIVNDLRSNAGTIWRNPEEIGRILSSHDYYKTEPKWSKSCSDANQEDGGFACGFWKLLHITSIGVVEQHKSVMGDLNRVMIPHVLQVIRDYVDFFGFATSRNGQELLIQEYDDCIDNSQCRAALRVQQKGFLHRIFRRRNLPDKADKSWRELGLWLWKVHQKYRSQRLGKTKNGYDSLANGEELQWPPPVLCSKCYSTRGMPGQNEPLTDDNIILDDINQIMWNKMPVFNHLKHEYWPRALQSPRVVVLDKWDNTEEAPPPSGLPDSAVSWGLLGFVGVLMGIIFQLNRLQLRSYQKHDYCHDHEDIDDAESFTQRSFLSKGASRSSRSRAFRPRRRPGANAHYNHGRGHGAGFRSGPHLYMDC